MAAGRPPRLQDLQHTGWTIERGAPPGIRTMIQGGDGFLWLGAPSGVYRFDGIGFERLPAMPGKSGIGGEPTALLPTRSGPLWVGYRRGGLGIYRRGRWRDPGMPAVEQPILAMAEERGGRIWVLRGRSDQGVALYEDGRWRRPPAAWQLPDQMYWSILIARDGALWLGGEEGVYVRRPGSDRFVLVAAMPDAFALAQTGDGAVWAGGSDGIRRVSRGSAARIAFDRPTDRLALAVDRGGALWAAHLLLGALRIADPTAPAATVERYALADGLSNAQATAVLLDREGDMWVATPGGLDRFRTTDLVRDTTIPDAPRDGFLLFGDGAGATYFADNDSVYQLRRDAPARLLARGIAHPGAVCRQADGGVWLGADQRVLLLRGGRVVRDARIGGTPFNFYGCAVDATGMLWAAGGTQGVLRIVDGRAVPVAGPGSDPRAGRASRMIADSQGRVLVYGRGAGLWRYDPGRITRWLRLPAALGTVSVLYRDGDTILLGGENGLARLKNDRIQYLDGGRYPGLTAIRTLLATRRGDTWISTETAVLRLRSADLAAAFDRPGRPLPRQLLGPMDGVPGPILPQWNLIEAADGRVGIATDDAIAWIDPAHSTRNPLPPPVWITALVANGVRIVDPQDLRLPSGTSRIEIDFTALGLARPDRVRFRYRLVGEDGGWIDPGDRRQAFYTNLAPGRYVFEVTAANESDVWNRRGARLAIHIPPTFLQSGWFKLLALFVAALLVWALYRARLTFVTDRLRNRLEARLAERERIARELHDTLLQGVQGLILRFQSVADQIPAGQKPRPLLDEALDRADTVLVEGRRRVREIRVGEPAEELGEAIAAARADLTRETPAALRLTVEGRPRPLHPLVRQESEGIALEAIRNALSHADAATVDVAIGYHAGEFRLGIQDDGAGMAADLIAAGKAGHFGIAGMRERARRIGGALRIASKPGSGTEVLLTVPARLAYPRAARYGLSASFWRALGFGRGRE